jgi:hypothetical protein
MSVRDKRTPEYNQEDCVYSPQVVVESKCCNRFSARSQLNGANGEATNSDDVSSKNSELVKLTKELAKIYIKEKKKGKAVKKPSKNKKGTRIANGAPTSRAMFNVGENLFHHSPGVQQLKGVAACVAAQFAPFDIPRGIANVLSEAIPSQKFSSRGYVTVSLAAGQKMFGFGCPNIYSDATNPSLVVATGTQAAVDGCAPFGTAAAGVTARSIVTATPYNSTTLINGRAEYRLVSHGMRIKCTSNAMNRGGSLIYLVDTNETFLSSSDSSATCLTLDDRMQGTVKSVRVALASQPVIEITCPHRAPGGTGPDAQPGWADTASIGFYDASVSGTLTGVNLPTSTGAFGQSYFVYLNGTGVTQTFDIELVEHWEVIFPGAEQLATPSVSHNHAAEAVRNIVHQAHQTHANHPTLSLKSVVKTVASMAHNKEVVSSIIGIGSAIAAL